MNKETRHLMIYGYTAQDLAKILRHFQAQLPEYITLSIESEQLLTRVTLTGTDRGVELLRFKVNKYHHQLRSIFGEDIVSFDRMTVPEVLGQMLKDRELTISCAESCTGGNIARLITQVPGSSAYFLGSIVSYANDIKAYVLKVPHGDLARYGAVSEQVVEKMASGVSRLMRADCAIATSGIAGPDGGTKYKPVGTVWVAAKYGKQTVTELLHLTGTRSEIIEKASIHAMVMMIRLLHTSYEVREDFNDE